MTALETTNLPLAGASVIVTRPQLSNAASLKRVRELGATPIALPGIGVTPDDFAQVRNALAQAQGCDIVVFISPLAVHFAFAAEASLHFAVSSTLCAIGAATAQALRAHAIEGVRYPEQQQNAEGLLALPLFQSLRGVRVALIGAAGGRDELPDELRARGALVQSINIYRRCAPTLGREHFTAVASAATPLITLISSSLALSHLHASLPADIFTKMAANDWVVSSLRLAAAAHALGCARVHIAQSAVSDAMLKTACAALGQHRL